VPHPSGLQALRRHDPWMLAAGPALVTMHLSWAAGFLRTILCGGRSGAAVLALGSPPTSLPAAKRQKERTGETGLGVGRGKVREE